MAKSNLSEIVEFLEAIEARARLLADDVSSKPLQEVLDSRGIDEKVPGEAMILFDTPEEALSNAADPSAKNIADALAKHIIGGANG